MQSYKLKSGLVGTGGVLMAAVFFAHLKPAIGAATVDAQDRQVAARVEQVIRSRVTSPNKGLKVVVTPSSRAEQGYFSQIVIEGHPVQIKKLRLAEFSLHARNVHLSVPLLQENKVHTIQAQTQLRAVVTEQDLTAMLANGRHTAKMGLVVKYAKDAQNGDVLRVSGNWSWSWFSGPVIGVGKLRLSNDNKVYADIISLQLNGREVPAFVKNKFSEKLNPVLDYNDVPFQPRFKSVKVEGSRAILFA